MQLMQIILAFCAAGTLCSCNNKERTFTSEPLIAIDFDDGPKSAAFLSGPKKFYRLEPAEDCQSCISAYDKVETEDGGAPYTCSYRMVVSGILTLNTEMSELPPHPPRGTIKILKVEKSPYLFECKRDPEDLLHN